MAKRSDLDHVIDRATNERSWAGVTFHGDAPYIQGGELNEIQTIGRSRTRRIGNLIACDGDRVTGAGAVVDLDAASVTLETGEIYIQGDVLSIDAATLPVALVGRVELGVRLDKSELTHEDRPNLKGQIAGSDAEGEPGAAREVWSIAWALSDDGGDGDFYRVYQMVDGTIIDQTPPPSLDGMTSAIAQYDRVLGHYIVSGCRVTALGKVGNDQTFAIEQGEANISGRKVTRHAALRISHPEDFEVAAVPGETHTIPSSGSVTYQTHFGPIAAISQILMEKEKTVTLVRGSTTNGQDGLPDSSVTEIISARQGSMIYSQNDDYVLTGNSIDWRAAGSEPGEATSFDVTYRYRDVVSAETFANDSITVGGGAVGGEVIASYTYKLPRIDLVCLDQSGLPVYYKGTPGAALAPQAPSALLKLAEIHNDWRGTPTLLNNGIYSVSYEEHARLRASHEQVLRILQLVVMEVEATRRDTAMVRRTFVDPFIDDSNRDDGEPQNAALFDGMMQLAIVPSFHVSMLAAPVMLDYVEDVIIWQEAQTACEPINPYQNFEPLPGELVLDPPVDFWQEAATEWRSPITREFNRGSRITGPLRTSSSEDVLVESRNEQAEFLRQIAVKATFKGLSAGEKLAELTFDGIDVKPASEQIANSDGEIDVIFTIPANVTAGTKEVYAKTLAGIEARALFTGQGTINIDVLQQVTSVNIWTRQIISRRARRSDPQAQTFTPTQTRQVVGVDFKLCAIGNRANNILINQVSVENGIPTEEVRGEALVPMAGAAVGWTQARYNLPLLTDNDREHAVVIKTDDGAHAVGIANLGGLDVQRQEYVSAQPYTIGVRHSSSNAKSWTAHQNSDLTFRIIAARYPVTEKTVDLGSFDLVDCSDLQIRAGVFLPSGDCSIEFEIERANGTLYRLAAEQVLQLDEYVTEQVQLRAVLRGTETLSPILFAPVVLIAGRIEQTATYVTKAFEFGSNIRLTDYFKAFLPAGSTVTVEYDLADDNWQSLPLLESEDLTADGWKDLRHEKAGVTGLQGRIRITLTGGPKARALLGDQAAAIY